MNRRILMVLVFGVISAAAVACGSTAAEPTAVPPTSTPAPSPTPAITIITESPDQNFDAFIAQLPEADVACLTAEVGEERLKALAVGDIEPSDEENAIFNACFSNEFVVGFIAGQIVTELGSFSGSSMACAASLLDDLPTRVLADLLIGDTKNESEAAQLAIQEFTLCLTNDELAALGRVNSNDEGEGDGGDSGGRRSSQDEQCMVDELGESFADGYGGVLGGGLLVGFASVIETCGIDFPVEDFVSRLEDTESKYTVADLVAGGFKQSKTYDIDGLESASSAHYGFYGVDPYNRLEYEVRFYFSHEAAMTAGVEFADEATGAGASLYADDQRWQEGLTERRRCDSNGGHHVGRCGFPKYFDYVVAGNMVLMCQGKETLESLGACADLLGAMK
jgi:hypothetical protein